MGGRPSKNKLSPEAKHIYNRSSEEDYTDYEIPVEEDILEAIASDYMKRESLRSADMSPHVLSHASSFIANSSSSKDLFVYGGSITGRSSYGVDLHSDEPAVDLPLSVSAVLRAQAARLNKAEDNPDAGTANAEPEAPPEIDDYYYNMMEKAIYEKPKPEAESPEVNFAYQKGSLLGSGAFGKVFLGLNEETGEMIAVKEVQLIGELQQQRKELENFNREVAVMKNLRHENIVTYKGTRVIDDNLNIFMEYVPGGSIASLLYKFGRLSEVLIRKYTRQILLGLEYLHSHHIMHRDIKGANILVSHQGVIKLADFGASRRLEGLMTANGGYRSLKGTPYWMAPEVVKQCGHGRQADIWSVGCTVIEMATGKPPWHEFTDQVSVLFHIASSDALPNFPTHLSPEAHDFLRLCFMRNPLERPNAARLLEHPFAAIPRKNSGSASALLSPTSPLSPKNMSTEDLSGVEAAQVVYNDYRVVDTKSSRIVPDGTYDNAIEEPTWTWDGERRNMNFVDSKLAKSTLRKSNAVETLTADRLQLDRRLKRSSTQDSTSTPPIATTSLATRRHSTFEAPPPRDSIISANTLKASAPAISESATIFARVAEPKIANFSSSPSGSPERNTPLSASTSTIDSDSGSESAHSMNTPRTPREFTEKKEIEKDVDEETIRNFLLRQSMEMLTAKEFKFGDPKQYLRRERDRERDLRAKTTPVPKNFFEQLGDLFYNSNNNETTKTKRSRTSTNHTIPVSVNKNGTAVKTAW